MQNKIEPYTEIAIGEYQKKNRSSINAIHVATQRVEKAH